MKKAFLAGLVTLLSAMLATSLLGCVPIGSLIDDFIMAQNQEPKMSRDETGLGSVQTDLLVGTWERDEGYRLAMPADLLTFDADGGFLTAETFLGDDMPFESRGYYSATLVEDNIVRLVSLDRIDLILMYDQRDRRQSLVDEYYLVEFDLEPFGVSAGHLVFNPQNGALEDPHWNPAWGHDSFRGNLAYVEGRTPDFGSGLSVAFDIDSAEDVLNAALAGEQTVGQLEVQGIDTWGFRSPSDDDVLPEVVYFTVRPFMEQDFIEFFVFPVYVRVDGDNMREFHTLEQARKNNDRDLTWAGTRQP